MSKLWEAEIDLLKFLTSLTKFKSSLFLKFPILTFLKFPLISIYIKNRIQISVLIQWFTQDTFIWAVNFNEFI